MAHSIRYVTRVTYFASQCRLAFMEIEQQEARRARSAALFNNRHFADVARAASTVAQSNGRMLTTRMVAAATGLSDSVVRPILLRLLEAEAIVRLPRAGGSRTAQYYGVANAALLLTVAELADHPAVTARGTIGPD